MVYAQCVAEVAGARILLVLVALVLVALAKAQVKSTIPSCMPAVDGPFNPACVPNPAGVPRSVYKKIGSKGKFLRKFYDAGNACRLANKMDSCTSGCYSAGQSDCQPPSLYQYFACPGSLAWQYYNCPAHASMGMACPKQCVNTGSACFSKPIPKEMGKLIFTGAEGDIVTNPSDEDLIPTANLALWQKAYGTCGSSMYLFKRQVCSKLPDKTIGKIACLKFSHCEWTKAGCMRKKASTGAILYNGDSALSKLESKCNAFKVTKGKSCWDAVFK